MQPIFIVGIIIFTGFLFGEACARLKLPKVTGYILAGTFLNPNLINIIPRDFVVHTSLLTNVALSFITFSVGGTLQYSRIRTLGKGILFITVFEAEFAFLSIILIFTFLAPRMLHLPGATMASIYIPLAFLLASLASPTDPSATLAVEHEYKAKGDVTSTIMGVAAFDDFLGIVNYTIAVAVGGVLIHSQSFNLSSILKTFLIILSSASLGCVFGLILNRLARIIKNEDQGTLIVLVFGLLSLCYGLATILNIDPLLATMTMGIIVVNFCPSRDTLFKVLEEYTEQLIFVVFFTISAMHLNFSVLFSNYPLIIIFVIFRALGKFGGTMVGGALAKSSAKVRRYTAGGLIPQGGIVIGLALIIRQNSVFSSISDIIISIIIGATIIHEIIGPVISKFALEKAGEISLEQDVR